MTPHDFISGTSYARDALLTFVGSRQAQSGIIWGAQREDVVICTSGGRHGAKVGYADHRNADGTWDYFGQGSQGDQNPQAAANRMLIVGDRSVLLFETNEPTAAEVRKTGKWRKQHSFVGAFRAIAWQFVIPARGKRANNRLLKLTLTPEIHVQIQTHQKVADGQPYAQAALGDLRAAAQMASDSSIRNKSMTLREYRVRSEATRTYALARASGVCEFCGKPAPFLTPGGVPFLEVHHLHRLADDGPDAPANVAGLCPNCHRQAHHGPDPDTTRTKLAELIAAKELSLAAAIHAESGFPRCLRLDAESRRASPRAS